MIIKEQRAIRGANYYHRDPVIYMKLDLEELEQRPTDQVPDCRKLLETMMPTLYEHTCSPGYQGGFFERVEDGTWAGHVVEHVAIELQCLAGLEVTFGKTYTMAEPGIYDLVYRYRLEEVGLRAGQMAVDLVESLFAGRLTEVEPLVEELKELTEASQLGPSTRAIVEEASRRGIPHIRLNQDSYVQLGTGRYQRRLQATLMDSTSALGVEIADDKARTKQILAAAGIPVPEGREVDSFEDVLAAAEEIGYPVVIKPLVGNHGRGVTVNIADPEDLLVGYQVASRICDTCVVEQYIPGADFRILVIGGKFTAAARREPAYVIGDGRRTIRELVDETNRDPRRGDGHVNTLSRIVIDDATQRVLSLTGLTLESIPGKAEKIFVKATANLSTGGIAVDVTDSVHPLNRRMAERIARLVGLDVMGIDVVAQTLEVPLENGQGGIVEVNAAPGFRMHLAPSEGTPRNIAAAVVDLLYPPGAKHSIPICAVTGTNGKTTTTRLITHLLGYDGSSVGLTSTDGVIIDHLPVLKGDYSGPEGAYQILTDPGIDVAVLEVARGGILRRGLGFRSCDVGVLLNITSDHLGEGGIDTLEELARLKSTVTEAVPPTGWAVFNADDPLVLGCAERSQGKPLLFSRDPDHPALAVNRTAGNLNVTIQAGQVVLQRPEVDVPIIAVNAIPITYGGKAGFNVENVLAAVSAVIALGMEPARIREALAKFSASLDQTPGRMNFFDVAGFKVVVDYSHNVAAVHATGGFLRELMPGRKIRLASGVGNRRGEDILAFGEAMAGYYDHIVLCDSDPRERTRGETARLVRQGLIRGGFRETAVSLVLDEPAAVRATLAMARPGDLVVLQADDIDGVIRGVLEFKREREGDLRSDRSLTAGA